MLILRTIHIGNVWVMFWELIATSAIVWTKYKMSCSPLCTSYLWVEFEGRTFTSITFRNDRIKESTDKRSVPLKKLKLQQRRFAYTMTDSVNECTPQVGVTLQFVVFLVLAEGNVIIYPWLGVWIYNSLTLALRSPQYIYTWYILT